MALEGSSLSGSKGGRRGDKEAADRDDVHMQMNMGQFVHPRSLSLHHTLSISLTEAFLQLQLLKKWYISASPAVR